MSGQNVGTLQEHRRTGPRNAAPWLAGLLVVLTTLATLATPLPARAQTSYSPVAIVNDDVITGYELSQRMTFFKLLRAQGDVRKLALEQLINERLQRQAARALGVTVTEEQVRAGMEEFAARGNLTADKLIAALTQAGVAAETFRDFVSAGVLWRETVRKRFTGKVTIPQAELERALALADPGSGTRLLLSAIQLPASTPQSRKASRLRAEKLRKITDAEAFAAAARRFSTAGNRTQGGALDWLAPEALPPAVRAAVAGLKPGQVSRPVDLGNTVAIYFMRERKVLPKAIGDIDQIDYAAYFMPGASQAQADALRTRVDTCDDLYGVALGQPPERLVRETVPETALPADYARQIARLDPNEASTALVKGDARVFLMLCSRARAVLDESAKKQVEEQLINRRLNELAIAWLQELRGTAHIEILAR